ncbi:MAG TPA: hypothetical protein VLF41_00870, partial [Candidatus Nanoarchaeia archaeon]|nr:hypothetical protein [Candidatus Nanoarchaeia archaeon]
MKAILRILPVVFLALVVATFYKPQAAHAACGPSTSWGIRDNSANSDAGLMVYTQLGDGSPVNVGLDLYETSNFYSIWQTSGGHNGSSSNAVHFITGSTYYSNSSGTASGGGQCSNPGWVILGYGFTNSQGNLDALDCKQVISPGGGNNAKTAVFNIHNIDTPAGHGSGYWSGMADFSVQNGHTTQVTLTWTDTSVSPPPPPPPSAPTIQGFLDTTNCSTIGGWANYSDGSSSGQGGRIDIYVNGPAGGGGTGWFGTSTNIYRSDVPPPGNFGFSVSTSGGNFNIIDGQFHSIYAYQFDNNGNPRQLPNSGGAGAI